MMDTASNLRLKLKLTSKADFRPVIKHSADSCPRRSPPRIVETGVAACPVWRALNRPAGTVQTKITQ